MDERNPVIGSGQIHFHVLHDGLWRSWPVAGIPGGGGHWSRGSSVAKSRRRSQRDHPCIIHPITEGLSRRVQVVHCPGTVLHQVIESDDVAPDLTATGRILADSVTLGRPFDCVPYNNVLGSVSAGAADHYPIYRICEGSAIVRYFAPRHRDAARSIDQNALLHVLRNAAPTNRYMVGIVIYENPRLSVAHNPGADDGYVCLQVRNRDAMLSVARKIAADHLDIRRGIRIKSIPTIPGTLAIRHLPLRCADAGINSVVTIVNCIAMRYVPLLV